MNQYKFQFRFMRIFAISFIIFFMFLPCASGEVTEIDSNFDGKWTSGNIYLRKEKFPKLNMTQTITVR